MNINIFLKNDFYNLNKMHTDLWNIVFEFIGDETILNNLRKVNKNLKKIVKFKYVSILKITNDNKYLLQYNLKNLIDLDCFNTTVRRLPVGMINLIKLKYDNTYITSLPDDIKHLEKPRPVATSGIFQLYTSDTVQERFLFGRY